MEVVESFQKKRSLEEVSQFVVELVKKAQKEVADSGNTVGQFLTVQIGVDAKPECGMNVKRRKIDYGSSQKMLSFSEFCASSAAAAKAPKFGTCEACHGRGFFFVFFLLLFFYRSKKKDLESVISVVPKWSMQSLATTVMDWVNWS